MSSATGPSTPTSDASTKVDLSAPTTPNLKKQQRSPRRNANRSPSLSASVSTLSAGSLSDSMVLRDRAWRRAQASSAARDVFLFLLALRILNALCVRTFFQPDEYFQALEPAWRMAFGERSGAWITWVRRAPHSAFAGVGGWKLMKGME